MGRRREMGLLICLSPNSVLNFRNRGASLPCSTLDKYLQSKCCLHIPTILLCSVMVIKQRIFWQVLAGSVLASLHWEKKVELKYRNSTGF